MSASAPGKPASTLKGCLAPLQPLQVESYAVSEEALAPLPMDTTTPTVAYAADTTTLAGGVHYTA